MPERIRLLVVDDNADLAQALLLGFEDHPTIESAGWIDATDRIIEAVRLQRPHVVLVDLTMPGTLHPLDVIRQLRASRSMVKVIAYSGYDDPARSRMRRPRAQTLSSPSESNPR